MSEINKNENDYNPDLITLSDDDGKEYNCAKTGESDEYYKT